MPNRIHRKKAFRGSALAFAIVIVSAVVLLLTSILTFVSSQLRNSLYSNAKQQTFQIAESGVQFYKWYLAHQTDGRTAAQIQAFWVGGTALGVDTPYEANYSDPSGTVVGRYRITVTPPTSGSTMVSVQSVGWTTKYPSSTRTIRVRFRRPSWSERTVLANDFMRFGQGTTVTGRIQSNQGVRFDGVAHNLVTSAVATFDDPDHAGGVEFGVHTHVIAPPGTGVNDTFRASEAPPNAMPSRPDVFQGGRQVSVPVADFNGVLGDLNYMKSEAQAGHGRYFNNTGAGRSITLKVNGTYDVCTVNSYDNTTNTIVNYKRNVGNGTCAACAGNCAPTNYAIVNNGVIFVEDNVWLSGQINGRRLSIVAADLLGGAAPSVFIPNNVLYTSYNGDDIIGIIAQNNVEIPLNSSNILRIDAAMLAQQGRVGRANYGMGDIKSTITSYGAIATNHRYGFAWTNGVQNWGYTTRNLTYDNNLLYFPPPYFPTGTQYFIDLWEEL
jgi:hypothetical protein